MNDKIWAKFLEWIYKAHQLSKDTWKPNRPSVELWEEYKRGKKK